jgi:hypothetical protein
VRTTVVVAAFLQKLFEPAVLRPAQVLDQPADRCPSRSAASRCQMSRARCVAGDGSTVRRLRWPRDVLMQGAESS